MAIFFVGCEIPRAAPVYFGDVTLRKSNGTVVGVSVDLIRSGSNTALYLQSPQEVEVLAEHIRSVLKDLEYAKEQMAIPEPTAPPSTVKPGDGGIPEGITVPILTIMAI